MTDLAQHTHDVAEMIAAGDIAAAESMHAAYVRAEFEREDQGATDADMLDLWMAGALLIAVQERLLATNSRVT